MKESLKILAGIISLIIGILLAVGVNPGIMTPFACLSAMLIANAVLSERRNRKTKEKEIRKMAVEVDTDFFREKSADAKPLFFTVKRKRTLIGALCPIFLFIDRNVLWPVKLSADGISVKTENGSVTLALAWPGENNSWEYSKEFVVKANCNVGLTVRGAYEGFVVRAEESSSGRVTIESRDLPLRWYKIWEGIIYSTLPPEIDETLRFYFITKYGGCLQYFIYLNSLPENADRMSALAALGKSLPCDLAAATYVAYEKFVEFSADETATKEKKSEKYRPFFVQCDDNVREKRREIEQILIDFANAGAPQGTVNIRPAAPDDHDLSV